jgi:adenylate cyclase
MASESYLRKLAAILYTDVAGYSRLTGADEVGTHKLLSEYLDLIAELIAQHHGQVVHYAGDAVLADFDMVSAALHCAVSIQRELASRNEDLPAERRVQFRIGVNLGEVIVDRNDIYGDGVNIAARLESLAEPGGICISESVRAAVGEQLPFTYEFLGEQQVKNIATPIRTYRVLLEGAQSKAKSQPNSGYRPSIAVLPFENLSGDPEQEYFVDGVTEDIITALSRVRWFFIIARHSAFAYKGRSMDVREVAKELGVQYIIEGSIRNAGNRIRVTAQLIDGSSGKSVWANRFDREYQDIFILQDELAETIVGALEPELGKAEREQARAKRPDNLHAWDLYQRGLWHLYHYTEEDIREAKRLFRKSLELDPGLGAAYSGLAEACYFRLVYGHSDSPDRDRKEALQSAQKAVALDYEDASAHCTLGRVLYVRREHDRAIPELETALEMNPSLAWGHYGLGAAKVFSGRASEAFPHLETAIRLSPRDPNMGSFLVRMADAHLFTRNYEEAVYWARKALQQPNFQWSRFAVLLSALGHLGRQEEAATVLEQVRKQRPDFSTDFVRETHLFSDPGDMHHYLEGLRKANVS